MFLILHLFLLLITLIEVNCLIADDDCRVLVCKSLTYVCIKDPKCLNDKVFYYFCLQRDVTPAQRESCALIPQDVSTRSESIYSVLPNWLDYSNTNNNDYPRLNLNYLYQDEQDKTGNEIKDPRSQLRELNTGNLLDKDKQEETYIRSKHQKLNTGELLKIYNLYKKHSAKKNQEYLQAKQDLLQVKTKNSIIDSDNSNTDKSNQANFEKLKKAIKLLKKTLDSSEKNSTTNDNKIPEPVRQDKEETAVTKKKKRGEDPRNLEYYQGSNPSGGREEIAIAEYKTDENKKSSGEINTKKELVIELSKSIQHKKALELGDFLQKRFSVVGDNSLSLQKLNQNKATYQIIARDLSTDTIVDKLNNDKQLLKDVENQVGLKIVRAAPILNDHKKSKVEESNKSIFKGHITIFVAIISGCTLALIIAAVAVYLVKRRQKDPSLLAFRKQEAVQDYQELCRTQMSVANARSDDEDEDLEKSNTMRHNWYNEFPYNMDISTGHVILSYMEDHLRNENRLNKEWEALCSYKADDAETTVGSEAKNMSKNRYRDVLPYDRTRVKLREIMNAVHSDYVNASFVTDVDPHNPDYIATQGPLDNTVGDFWQMVWEQGVVVIVNLTKLSDMGLPQCHRYWPENGSEIYHIYEVHLISEHIWCDDYLVRSLYLKNLQTSESRTITQFHYLTWPDLSIPETPKPLLEFRRKVNKCYRGQGCPIIIHCNNGVGRTGTYILLDMVVNKMVKGTKEIDIAATLEHLRDQRPDMVKTKGQFEFALTAMAEEVTAILTAAPK